MQIYVQDVRIWGNMKILTNYAQSEEGVQAFIERLRIQHRLLCGSTCAAYSFPRHYNKLYDKIMIRYFGMTAFMNNLEPWIRDLDAVDASIQRRFRNAWSSCWNDFQRSLMGSPETRDMLSELGLQLCFVEGFDQLPQELFDFYNTVLKWYVYTCSECAMSESGVGMSRLVEFMVIASPQSFCSKVLNGFTS